MKCNVEDAIVGDQSDIERLDESFGALTFEQTQTAATPVGGHCPATVKGERIALVGDTRPRIDKTR